MRISRLTILFFLVLIGCTNRTEKAAIELAKKNKYQDSIANIIIDKITSSKKMLLSNDNKETHSNINKDWEICGKLQLAELINFQFDSLNQTRKENIFIRFRKAYKQIIEEYNSSSSLHYPELQELSNHTNVEQQEEIEKDFNEGLAKDGAVLSWAEGSCFIDEKPDYLYNVFKNRISNELTEYLRITSKELEAGFSNDGGLSISFEDLYERIITWEDFINKNPHFFLKMEAKDKYLRYLSTFLTGMDNTPIFEYESKKLSPEVKRLYEKIIAKNESRNSTKAIKEVYIKLKNNNFAQIEEQAETQSKPELNNSSMLAVKNSSVTISFFAEKKDSKFVSSSNNIICKQKATDVSFVLKKYTVPKGKTWTFKGFEIQETNRSGEYIMYNVVANIFVNGNQVSCTFCSNGNVLSYKDQKLIGGTGRLSLEEGDGFLLIIDYMYLESGVTSGKLFFEEK